MVRAVLLFAVRVTVLAAHVYLLAQAIKHEPGAWFPHIPPVLTDLCQLAAPTARLVRGLPCRWRQG
jgi:hypothetical protein